ncbi:sodium-potassium ATPase [Pholiota conissans]|uniref:Sodium-potassium ATPase n=1 Tax=Pholiota conissans TaxID=109636 RepID=A0A9P5Z7U7_9AGAR|nr:sodium-potassium ATPase [Pholiota conissans]
MPPPPTDVEKDGYIDTQPRVSESHRDGHGITRTVEPGARFPIEYQTLSIHVDNSTQSMKGGAGQKRGKIAVKELASLDWHKISVEETLSRLSVSPKTGLEAKQVSRNEKLHGKNVISPPKSNMGRKLLEWVLGGFGSLLLAASIVCFIAWKPLGEPNPQASNLALAIVLLIVLVIQAVFNAWQDFSTSRVMASIKGMLPSDVLVLRDSASKKVPAKNLVPGDLITISMGEKVPADLRLIEVSSDLQFDRSILTGEAISGRVDMTDDNFLETKNIALQGTHCVSGSGTGVVIQIGDNTVFGMIAKLSSMEATRLTTLQRELLRFVAIIAGMATLVAIFIVILWAAWLRKSHPAWINVPGLLIDVVSVMVAFIPEGLPVAVTLSMAKVAHTLSQKKILCKSLSIVETLGSVNVLCSDKTGTLTQNIMHVENLAIFDTPYESDTLRAILRNAEAPVQTNLSQVAAVGAICNSATFDNNVEVNPDEKKIAGKSIIGNATDVAILRFSDNIASAEITRQRWINVFRRNFNSKTKFMLQLSKLSPTIQGSMVAPLASWDNFTPGCFLMTVKGAPEVLLPYCSFALNPNGGAPIHLSDEAKERIAAVQDRWSRQGQRVLLLARRVVRDQFLEKSVDTNSEEFGQAVDNYMTDLIVVGLVGLIDPLKPDIKHTVDICRKAGIRFFIVTGDHPNTALSIAGQAGIITNVEKVDHATDLDTDPNVQTPLYDVENEVQNLKSIIVTGPELTTLNSVQMYRLCQYEEVVFARTTPEQKLRIVNAFRGYGNVVAVTGDGVNDAPSLKAADCGIAMGDGSDVAKEAADLVLLGDFSSIIVAIEYGRLVFDNLKKTVLYLLPAGSFSELMPILLNVIIGVPQILSNIQMIVICVATDVLPALSLCMEPPENGLLLRRPRNVKKDRLANTKLIAHAYLFLGVLESLCAMTMAFWYLQRHGVPFSSLALSYATPENLTNDLFFEAQSVYFFTLVIMQWGNLLATRGRTLSIFQHTPLKNLYIFPAAILALGIAFFFDEVPFFQKVFQMHPVPVEHIFIPMTFGLGLLFFDEVRKFFVRKYPRGLLAKIAW